MMISTGHWKKSIALLWVAQFLLMCSPYMSHPFWPLFIRGLTASKTTAMFWSAIIYIAPLLASMVAIPFWAKMGDRLGHKNMLLRAGVGLMITQGLIAVFPQPAFIAFFRLLQGVFAGCAAATQAYATAITPESHRGRVLGLLQSAIALGTFSGPLLGSMLAQIGYRHIFAFSSGLCAVTLIILYCFLPSKSITHKINQASEKKEVDLSTKKSLFREPTTFFLLSMICAAQVAQTMLLSFFALFVIDKLEGSASDVGILYSASAVTIFFFASIWGKVVDNYLTKNKSLVLFLVLLFLSCAIFQYGLLFAHTTMFVLIQRLLFGIFLAAILPTLFTLLTHQAKYRSQGHLIGLGNSMNKLGEALGIIIGAILQSSLGYNAGITAISIVYMSLVLAVFAFSRINNNFTVTITSPSSANIKN